jgi:hypothetical protein
VLRHLDLVVLAAALPVFVVAGLPLLGYAAPAAAWLLQGAIEFLVLQRAREAGDRRTALGALAGAFFARISLTMIAVVAAGIAERDAGVAAGLLAVVVFTVHLSIYAVAPPFGRPAP